MIWTFIKWLLVPLLTGRCVLELHRLGKLLRVRRQIGRIIGGIPIGTAARLFEIHANRIRRGYGRRIFPRWSPMQFLVVYTPVSCAALLASHWKHSLVVGAFGTALLLHVIHLGIYTATPPMVLYLGPSTYEAHRQQWKLAEALRRAVGPCRVISMLDPSVLNVKVLATWDMLYDLTFRMDMDRVTNDDWFAAIYWLMDIVPLIVIEASGTSDEWLHEAEMVFQRHLEQKALFVTGPDGECSSYSEHFRRFRLKGEPWRFVTGEQLIVGAVAMLRVAGRSGIVSELGARARERDRQQ